MHAQDPGASKESHVRAALAAGAVDTAITLAAFVASRSSVILADFLKTVLEFAAVGLAWYTLRRVRRGGGHQYQYGVGKMEQLSSLGIGALMIVCLGIIVCSAIRNLLHPGHISGAGVWISVVAQAVFAVVNGRLCWQTFRAARAGASPLMQSQARLLLSRAIANAFILLALGLSLALDGFAWAAYIDPLASLVIAVSILLSALGIFSTSVYDLLDGAVEEKSQIVILRELVRFHEDFEQLHGIRTRRSGSQVFIEIFLEFAADKSVGAVQRVIDDLTGRIEEALPGSRAAVALTTRKVN